MDRMTLRSELKSTIAYLLEIDDFRDDQHFMRDLGADSMLLIEVVARIEKRYGTSVPEEELRKVRCLTDVVKLIGDKMGLPG